MPIRTTRSRPERTRRLPARAVVLLAALIALSVATGDVLAQRDLNRTRGAIAHTRRDRASLRRRLRTEQTDLGAAQDSLDAAKASLADRSNERDQLRAAVYLGTVDLNGARGDLSAARQQLDAQGARITTLATCLEGISRTMSQLAVNDRARGLATLRSVQGACRATATAAPFLSAVGR